MCILKYNPTPVSQIWGCCWEREWGRQWGIYAPGVNWHTIFTSQQEVLPARHFAFNKRAYNLFTLI